MLIKQNGVAIESNINGKVLAFQVIEQSKEFKDILKHFGNIQDPESKFSIRSNKYPAFSKKLNRFFVRGNIKEGEDKIVEIAFSSIKEAQEAQDALKRMVELVKWPEDIEEHNHNIGQPHPGGTTYLRFALITSSQARHLNLSAKEFYPEARQWENCEPIVTENKHYNEHIGQAVDVMNKAHGAQTDAQIINQHRVTNEQATMALDAIKKGFDKAEKEGYLIAYWRLITGIRGPDFVDMTFQQFINLLNLLMRKRKDPAKLKKFLQNLIATAQEHLRKI